VILVRLAGRGEQAVEALGRGLCLAGDSSERVLDRDLLLQARRLLAGRDAQHPVEVEVELYQDLVAGRNRGEAFDREGARLVVSPYVVLLALIDVDLHRRLAVTHRLEDLAAARWQRRVAANDRRELEAERPAECVPPVRKIETADAQRMRRDINKHRS